MLPSGRKGFHLLWQLIVIVICFSCTQGGCSKGWFGDDCQYKCHCSSVDKCASDGSCLQGSSCQKGWFGPACQYQDLIIEKDALITPRAISSSIKDGNDSSCSDSTEQSMKIEFSNARRLSAYYFSWMRICVTDTSVLQNVTVRFKNNTGEDQHVCINQKTTIISPTTMDIHCENEDLTTEIELSGIGAVRLCSVYVSGGRNVALKQDTFQTSTYVSQTESKTAVDGNNSTDFRDDSCTHTKNLASQYWEVHLNNSWVNRYTIFNRVGFEKRLQGFVLERYGNDGSLLFTHKDQDDPQLVYEFNDHFKLGPAERIKVYIAVETIKTYVLTLCEVELYGDSLCEPTQCQDRSCPIYHYGRDCEHTCRCEQHEQCFVSTGACPHGCPSGWYGEGCRNECDKGKYGKDCAEFCSIFCSNGSCDSFNGTCDGGCIDGYKPPNCVEECDHAFYGPNCSLPCSDRCVNGTCNAANGNCEACIPGYVGPTCEVCPKTSYGVDCRQKCSINCLDQDCDHISGNCHGCNPGKQGDLCSKDCDSGKYGNKCEETCSKNCAGQVGCNPQNGTCLEGCHPGYRDSLCTEPCYATTYGAHCRLNCSENCITDVNREPSVCHHKTGSCLLGCKSGFEGPTCAKVVHDEDAIGVIVGPILVLLLLGVIAIIGFFVWRRHKIPNSNKLLDNGSRADISEGDRLNGSNPITMSQVVAGDKPSKNVSEVEATPTGEHGDQVYYNTLQAPYKTSIAVDELNNFLRTHDKQYFEEQFKKIPTTCNAPMSIGMGPENKHKNRYKNICTYDHSRVLLTADAEKKLGDYINASYVQGYKSDEKFIASQGPNKVILDDFVRMLWEHKTDKVVMLTNLVEEGKHKCEKYWPETDEVQFGEIRVRLITTQVFADYTIRRLQLMKVGHPTHSLTQFHFTSWPDKGVPSLPWPLVDFEQRVASFPTSEPIVVHCSAGVGRTGTFIGLRNVMREAEETGTMDFYTTLWKLRQDRVYMIQTVEQYIFLHHAAQVAMVCIGTTVTIDDIRDRIDVLNRVSGLAGETNLDKEFKAVCRVCDDGDGVKDDESSRDNFSDTYMNSRTASNKFKNRFSNVLPKDLYRPYLSCETRDLSDYINAVLLPSFVKQNQQILTQLPLPTTVLDFWRLVTQFKVSLVVAFETDLEDLTCGKYLPEENAPLQTGSFDVEIQPLTRDDSWEMANLCVTIHRKRKPRLSTSSAHTEEHCLKHVKCSVSDLNIEKLLNIVNQVRSCRQGNGKIVYMCRNGADFSGLVCVLTLLLDRLDNDHRLTVPLVVGAIKAIRPQVIPTVEQYRMLYDVLQLYHDSSVYCNFGDAKSKSDQSHGKSNEAFNGDENVYANS